MLWNRVIDDKTPNSMAIQQVLQGETDYHLYIYFFIFIFWIINWFTSSGSTNKWFARNWNDREKDKTNRNVANRDLSLQCSNRVSVFLVSVEHAHTNTIFFSQISLSTRFYQKKNVRTHCYCCCWFLFFRCVFHSSHRKRFRIFANWKMLPPKECGRIFYCPSELACEENKHG